MDPNNYNNSFLSFPSAYKQNIELQRPLAIKWSLVGKANQFANKQKYSIFDVTQWIFMYGCGMKNPHNDVAVVVPVGL